MLCAIKADNTVTAMAVLSYQPGGLQNQFLIVGDVAGKLYAFNTRGQVAMEHDAGKLTSCSALAAVCVHASHVCCAYMSFKTFGEMALRKQQQSHAAHGNMHCIKRR